jgi:hypothetical protein
LELNIEYQDGERDAVELVSRVEDDKEGEKGGKAK